MKGLKEKLTKIAGKDNVLDEISILEKYSCDKSFAMSIIPRYVVKVQNGAQAESLVKLANKTKTPLVPVSSGAPHYKGDTVPSVPEAVIADLSGMKRILNINKTHRIAVIEPGVSYEELDMALAKEGMEIAPCLAPRATKSVVGSLLELEPRLNAMHQWAYTDPLRCMEVTWGDGNRMYTGEAGGYVMNLEQQWMEDKWQVEPVGPMMLDFFRLLTCAQGTMGLVTWASVRCELKHQTHRSFFVTAKKVEELIEFVWQVVHFRFSDELFIMNNAQLASLLGEDAEEIEALKKVLPAWVALVGVGGRDLLPEERAAQQEADIADITQRCGLPMVPAAGCVSAEKAMNYAKGVCKGIYWKERLKGAFQDIFFTTTLDKTAAFISRMYALAIEEKYCPTDIGIYIQPLHCGSAYHVEFTLPYDPQSKKETEMVQALFMKASLKFAAMDAFYARPYGIWADIQMNKDAMGKKALNKLKGIFDPNGIMNPGKLCL